MGWKWLTEEEAAKLAEGVVLMTHLDPDADPHEVNRYQQVRGQEIGALRREAKQPGRRSRRVRDLMRPVVMSMRKHGQSLGEIALVNIALLSIGPKKTEAW